MADGKDREKFMGGKSMVVSGQCLTGVINRETRPEFSEIDPRKKGKETFLSKRIYSILFVNLKKKQKNKV